MPNKGEKFHIKYAMQLIFVIVAGLILARIIAANFKLDSIIVNDFIANFSFTDVASIAFLPSDWQ